jgi:hypothetical protein
MSEEHLLTQDDRSRLSPQQLEIYTGLRNIGEEIAELYYDGCKIIQDSLLLAKSYHLGNILREIDGGLRDVLVVRPSEKCPTCQRITGSHIDSVCDALGVDRTHPLATKWVEVSKGFHKYAHRQGAWKSARDAQEAIFLWNRFEEILFDLVGTYLNLLDRVRRILGHERPTEQILGTLKNLLHVEALNSYFFRNLRSKHWLVPLKLADFFNPQNNPYPEESPDQPGYFRIPYWSVLDYAEIISRENSKSPEEDITETLVEITNDIISYRDENGKRIENDRTDWMIVRIFANLPTSVITKDHIQFIRDSLNSKWRSTLVAADIDRLLIPKLLSDKAVGLLIELIDVMLDYKKLEGGHRPEYVSIMDPFWLAEALKKHKQDIARLCGIQAVQPAMKRMKLIVSEDSSRFDFITVPTTEDDAQITFPERYECQLVQFVRDMYEYCPESAAMLSDVKSLFSEEHPIFRRIVFHLINKRYTFLKAVFWESVSNPIDFMATHEIYEMLKDHCIDLGESEIGKLLEWIDAAEYQIPEGTEVDKEGLEKSTAKRKKELLSVLRNSGSRKVKEKYDHYNELYPYELDHAGFLSWTKSGVVEQESPLTTEELCSMSNQEIAEHLIEFKNEGKVNWNNLKEITVTGAFRKCVRSKPEKFSRDLDPFLEVPSTYRLTLFWSLAEAWRDNKEFEWNEILEFIWKLVEGETFWQGDHEEWKKNDRNSIIVAICDLLQEGTKSDAHAFNPDLLSQAEKILLHLLNRTESDFKLIVDYPTSVLNSTKCKIYTALMSYSLRYARLYRKDEDYRWKDQVKLAFANRLDRKIEPALEYWVIIGIYFADLYYLDKRWVTENIDRIFSTDNPDHWEASMSGYLLYASKVYRDTYDLLSQSRQYQKGIHTAFKDKYASQRLVQHICIGFMEGWELLEDDPSLISKIVANVDPNQLRELTRFIWTYREKLGAEQKIKVKELWGKIMATIGDKLSEKEYLPVASNLALWLSLVDEIDAEVFEWMKRLVKCLDRFRSDSFIAEYLLRHVEKTPQEVGEIYVEMLSSEVYPLYKEDDIREIVGKLYTNNCKNLADRICNMYAKKGHVEILEAVYMKYHRKG